MHLAKVYTIGPACLSWRDVDRDIRTRVTRNVRASIAAQCAITYRACDRLLISQLRFMRARVSQIQIRERREEIEGVAPPFTGYASLSALRTSAAGLDDVLAGRFTIS